MSTMLVTGGAGFIGFHLTQRLLKEGHKVLIVDDLSSGNSDHLTEEVTFTQLDLADKRLGELFAYNEISCVFHLAAQTNVPQSCSFPLRDATSNILGTINLLEKCTAFKVKKLIYLSGGAAVYGESGAESVKESHPLKPISALGLSKAVGEQYIELAGRTEGLDHTILRCANVYGPHQDPYSEVGLVASLSHFLISEQTPTIYGDGSQTRDFLYVDNLIEAILLAMDKGSKEVINIGSGTSTSVQEIFNRIKRLTAFDGEPYYRPARAGEIKQFSLNVDKAKEVLNWQAQTNLPEGLQKTVEYYRQTA